jgi:hypothetical protein
MSRRGKRSKIQLSPVCSSQQPSLFLPSESRRPFYLKINFIEYGSKFETTEERKAKEKYMDHQAPNYTFRQAHSAPRQDILFANIILSYSSSNIQVITDVGSAFFSKSSDCLGTFKAAGNTDHRKFRLQHGHHQRFLGFVR